MRTMHYDVMKPFLLQFHLTIFIVIYYYRQYSHLLFISNIVYDTEFFGLSASKIDQSSSCGKINALLDRDLLLLVRPSVSLWRKNSLSVINTSSK